MPRSPLRTLGFLLLAVVMATAAVAQTTTGTIRGQILDYEGNPLPGVAVTATNVDRGTSRTDVTGESGYFVLTSLQVGNYDVLARLEGFQDHAVEGVRVGIASTVELDFSLALTTIEEEIVVSAVPVLNLSNSSVKTSFDNQMVEELPTTRNWWDLMALAPGISQESEQSTQMSALGSSIASNSWNIDGLDTTNPDTGTAWWYLNPDTIEEVQVLAIGAPASYGNMSGAALNVVTKSGTNTIQGAANIYFQDDSLTGTGPKINGIPFSREEYLDLTLSLGGPIKRDKVWFFAAYQNVSDQYSDPGVDPAYPTDLPSYIFDIKVDAQLTESTSMNAKYHYQDWDWTWADPYSTPDATGSGFGVNPAWGLGLDSVIGTKSLLEINFAGYTGDDDWLSSTRSQDDPFIDRAPADGGPWRYSGSLWYPYRWDIERNQVDATFSTHADDFLRGDHEFKFGVSYGEGSGDTITAGGVNGRYYYRNLYTYEYDYYGYIYEYEYFYRASSRAYHYGAETETISAFIDDSWRVTENLTLNIGVRYDSISSDIPAYPELDMNWQPTGNTLPGLPNAVEWNHFSPRLGFAYRMGENGVLRGFYGKFYDGNVTGNWYAPPPEPAIWTYEYSSSRNGPWSPYYIWEWHSNTVDPGLDPPETDQFTLGYDHQVTSNMALGIQGVYKDVTNLIGWEVLGDGVYEMVPWTNPFDGEVLQLASIIEEPTRQKGNRPGEGSLAPPGQNYEQDFTGIILMANKRYSDGWSLTASYTWSDSNGFLPNPQSQGQGNPFYTSTSGRDPNNWINAEQALQNEREHVIQAQSTFDLPWKLLGTAVFRYLDGKPYSRQMSVGGMASNAPLNQGSQTVIVIPAKSSTSLPSQTVLDMSLGRDFPAGPTEVGVVFKVFNIFGDEGHDWWQTLNVPPGDSYVPSGYIWPRRAMVQLRLRF